MQDKHKLRAERDKRQLTQKALGIEAQVSPSTISNIECHRGPDVPRAQLRRTKTKLSTALKLTVALSNLPAGEYTLPEFVSLQTLFTEEELFEALVNQQKRERERQRRTNRQRHLRLVS